MTEHIILPEKQSASLAGMKQFKKEKMLDKIVELFKDTKALPIYIFEFVVFTLVFFFMLNVLRKNNAI